MNEKSYWEMTAGELAVATKEFDEEFVADGAKPLTPQMKTRWERAVSKTAPAENGQLVLQAETPAQKAAKTRRRRQAARKAALTRKRRQAGTQAALTKKRRAAARKAAETRRARAR